MARIHPLKRSEIAASVKIAFERHSQEYGGHITNMKATLGRSLPVYEAYMQWYELYKEVEKVLDKRLAYIYAYAISASSESPLCMAFLKKLATDKGENPDLNQLTKHEQDIFNFGASISRYHGNIANHVYDAVATHYSEHEMLVLAAFSGLMIAANVFNNVVETDIDYYFVDHLPALKYQRSIG